MIRLMAINFKLAICLLCNVLTVIVVRLKSKITLYLLEKWINSIHILLQWIEVIIDIWSSQMIKLSLIEMIISFFFSWNAVLVGKLIFELVLTFNPKTEQTDKTDFVMLPYYLTFPANNCALVVVETIAHHYPLGVKSSKTKKRISSR